MALVAEEHTLVVAVRLTAMVARRSLD